MSRHWLCFAGMTLFAAAVPAAAHDSSPSKGQHGSLSPSAKPAAAVVDAFHAALRRGDERSAAALLASEAMIFESGGVEWTKAEYEAKHLPADAEFTRAVPGTVSRRVGNSDGKLAWIATEGRLTGTFRDKKVDRVTTETMVLRRTGGAWKIIHIHWSSGSAP